MNNNSERPVFFDPNQKRWPRLRGSVYLSGLVFSVLFGLLIVGILVNPELPALDCSNTATPAIPPSILIPSSRLVAQAARSET
jgi:hypothetical protein